MASQPLKHISFLAVFIIATFGIAAQTAPPPYEKDFTVESVARGLDSPWALAFPSREGALVTLKGGLMEFIDLKTGARSTVPGLPRIRSVGQGGLLDLALAPDFEESREIFLSFSEERDGKYGTSVARARFLENPARIEGWKVIFSANNVSGSTLHFGSRLAFDRDGFLYVTVGERNERQRARDPSDHGGKTLRLDRNGRGQIFTSGHRNAQGLTLNPSSGKLWLHEHGPRGGDEVNILKAGADYGWPLVSYGREYSGSAVGDGASSAPGITEPLLYWVPSIAPSGMAFYSGSAFPAWNGDLLVGALAGMELRRVDLEGEKVLSQTSYLKGWARIRDVRLGPDSSIYILTDGAKGGLWRLVPS
ncbi:PQQ-dependent sugar dehydrogenase [Treponema sp.]